MYSSVVENKIYENELKNSKIKIQNIIDKNIIYNKNFISNKIMTSYRNTISNGGINRIVENIILEYAYKCELNSAYSSDIFFDIYSKLSKYNNLDKSSLIEINKYLNSIKEDLSFEDIKKCLYELSEDKTIADMVIEAIILAGVDGKINIDKSHNSDVNSVELINGYNFKLSPYQEFLNNDLWIKENCKIFILDGILEKVSEIHSILTDSSETKEPIMFLSRGFSEEVIATFSENKKRGILDVLPIRVPYEIESINFIADIAICCNSDIITSFKGDVISLKKYEDLSTIEKIYVSKNNINIINSKSVNNVHNHINSLIQKKKENLEQDVIDLIDKRILNFTSRQVNIKLKKNSDKEQIINIENIDYLLRTYKSLYDYGIIDYNNFISYINNTNLNCLKTIKNFGKKPLLSVYSAINFASKVFEILNTIELCIMKE